MSDYWAERARKNEARAQRLATSTSARQAKLYRDVQQRIQDGLDSLYAQVMDQGGVDGLTRTQLWQCSKYKQLQEIIQDGAQGIKAQQVHALDSTLSKVLEDTCRATLDQLGRGDLRFTMLQPQQVRQILDTAWSGKAYSARVWDNTNKVAQRISRDITDLITMGKSPGDIKAAIKRDLNVGYNAADRLVRTEANHVFNAAAQESYRAAGVQRVELLIEEDGGQCEECDSLAGEYDIDNAPKLPIHPGCRCCLAPVIEL